MTIESKFGLNAGGIHFSEPWLMVPMTLAVASVSLYDSAAAANAANIVAFFTGLAEQGVIDSTNWAANTYKPVYSHTGKGLIAGMIGCTAGGAESTTFEITIDGVLSELTVNSANGERAALFSSGAGLVADFTTANQAFKYSLGALDAGTLTTFQTAVCQLMPLRWYAQFGVPMLRYNVSCTIRMKHSVIITNSTATAYSGVMVRKGIAA